MIKNKIWKIRSYNEETVRSLSRELGLDWLFALLLNSKGITDKESARSFLTPDLINDLHNPFLFRDMEKAVHRIRQAIDRQENIFIYGDRDVDGVSSAAMVFKALKKLKAHVKVSVPSEKDGYGINEKLIDQFKNEGCDLIITVDNGISEFDALRKAREHGIDVIVTDHHTPGDRMPDAYAIINPKCDDLYPFKDLAGVGVAYKLLCGLFFSYSQYYDKDIVVLDLETTGTDPDDDEIIEIGAVKLRNFIKTGEFHRYVKPERTVPPEIQKLTGITNERLLKENSISPVIRDFSDFIRDAVLVGHNIEEFDIRFIKREMKQYWNLEIKNEMVDTLTLARNYLPLDRHKLERVAEHLGIISQGPFHNAMHDTQITLEIFKKFYRITKKLKNIIELFSEYAVLGSIADLVPLLDENRLIVRKGIEKLNKPEIPGLELLFRKMNLPQRSMTTRILSWKVIPILNAAGRMGMAAKALQLLITEDKREAERIVDELLELNQQRKDKQSVNFEKVMSVLEKKVDVEKDKIFIIDIKDMEHGVTGVIANRILEMYYRPVVILILKDGEGIGTARSFEQFRIYDAFKKCEDLFIDFGGHRFAVGFSIKEENVEEFKRRLKQIADELIKDEDLVQVLEIDAEILPEQVNVKSVKKLEQLFEPFGEDNREPLFLFKGMDVVNVQTVGLEKKHLKLRLARDNKHFFDALYWGAVELGRSFQEGVTYDIVFRPEINLWNDQENISLIIEDVRETEKGETKKGNEP